jgi:hypothetical protein
MKCTLKRNFNPKIFGRPCSDLMSINICLADLSVLLFLRFHWAAHRGGLMREDHKHHAAGAPHKSEKPSIHGHGLTLKPT